MYYRMCCSTTQFVNQCENQVCLILFFFCVDSHSMYVRERLLFLATKVLKTSKPVVLNYFVVADHPDGLLRIRLRTVLGFNSKRVLTAN